MAFRNCLRSAHLMWMRASWIAFLRERPFRRITRTWRPGWCPYALPVNALHPNQARRPAAAASPVRTRKATTTERRSWWTRRAGDHWPVASALRAGAHARRRPATAGPAVGRGPVVADGHRGVTGTTTGLPAVTFPRPCPGTAPNPRGTCRPIRLLTAAERRRGTQVDQHVLAHRSRGWTERPPQSDDPRRWTQPADPLQQAQVGVVGRPVQADLDQ